MKLTGGEVIIKHLIAEKVPYILGIPGHGVLGLFDAIRKATERNEIKYIQVKHEQSATFLADGYFRVSGKPLAVFASIGPGTLNTAIGLATAYTDSSAYLQLAGDTHTHMKGVGVLQEIERYADSNIVRSLEPLSKRSWRAESVAQLPRIISRAFNLMTTGRSGPCSVTLPMDVQADSVDCELIAPNMSKTYSKPKADMQYIKQAVELMKTAKRPLIMVGAGALQAKADKKIVELAEKWGAAIITTLAGKGAVAETHPQYAFHTGAKGTPIGLKISANADVVFAIGCRFADETTCSYRKGVAFNFPDTKLIHIDIDSQEIGKNYGADIGIVSDLNDAIDKIMELNPSFEINAKYLEEIVSLREDWFNYLAKMRAYDCGDITISQLIGKLNECLPKDTIIATSSGNTQAQLFQEYCYAKPYCNLTTGGFSTMGWCFPAAMGAKLAFPDKPVVCLVGDGDFLMVVQELATLIQYNIPVIVIVADNSGWFAIKDLQVDVLGKDKTFGNDFLVDGKPYSPDFIGIAKSFGVDSYYVDELNDINSAISNAIKANKPALITMKVSREHPYSGGKAFGWWDVPIPTYYEEKREIYLKGKKEETV